MSQPTHLFETNLQRTELVAEIQHLLAETPPDELAAVFEPAVVLIQSESQTDNQCPPKEAKIFSDTLRLLEVWPFRYQEASRNPKDYYFTWDAVTAHTGLFMNAQGDFFHTHLSGHGEFAAFPSRPGNTGVRIEVKYLPADFDLEDISDDDLESLSEVLAEALGG